MGICLENNYTAIIATKKMLELHVKYILFAQHALLKIYDVYKLKFVKFVHSELISHSVIKFLQTKTATSRSLKLMIFSCFVLVFFF